jgi:hypothetical protein
MIYTEKMAESLSSKAGQKWRPSNGTEGEMFISAQCDGCKRWNGGDCKILMKTMFFDPDEEDYPSEWCYADDGQPTCTAFAKREERKPVRCKLTPDMFGSTGDDSEGVE